MSIIREKKGSEALTTEECSLWGFQAKLSTSDMADHLKPECGGCFPSFCNNNIQTHVNDKKFGTCEIEHGRKELPIQQSDQTTN